MRDFNYSVVLFDMDGVIVDSMIYHAESWIEVFKDYGVEVSKEEILKREGMPGLASIMDVVKESGAPLPDVNTQNCLLEKKLQLFERYKIEVFPFVKEILDFLSSKDITLGLVTGSMRRSVNHVLPRDIFDSFKAVVTVDNIVNGKPHPEPYLKALSLLECSPEDTLVIENAPLGIESAKEAGLECFAVSTTLPGVYLKKADKIFDDHKSLYEFFLNNCNCPGI